MRNCLIFCLTEWAGGANSGVYFLEVVVEGGVACQELSGYSQIPSTHFGQFLSKSIPPEHIECPGGFRLVEDFPIFLRLTPKRRIADTTRHREQNTSGTVIIIA